MVKKIQSKSSNSISKASQKKKSVATQPLQKKSNATTKKPTQKEEEKFEEADFTKFDTDSESESDLSINDSDSEEEEEQQQQDRQKIAKNVDLKKQDKKFQEGTARAKKVAAEAANNKSSTVGAFGEQFEYDSSSDEEEDDNEDAEDDENNKKTKKSKKQQQEQQENNNKQQGGVLYIGRIPHGFYEPEMMAYFSQFGTVTRLRISRSKKTGRSRHYGFIEFASPEVAQIVQETMDNYLLFGHLLKVKTIPPTEIPASGLFGKRDVVVPKLVKTKDPVTGKTVKTTTFKLLKKIDYNLPANWNNPDIGLAAMESHNRPRSKKFWQKIQNRTAERVQKNQMKLATLGISYSIADNNDNNEKKESVEKPKKVTKKKVSKKN